MVVLEGLAVMVGYVVMALILISIVAVTIETIKDFFKERTDKYKLERLQERLENNNGWLYHEHKELLDRYVIDLFHCNRDLFK